MAVKSTVALGILALLAIALAWVDFENRSARGSAIAEIDAWTYKIRDVVDVAARGDAARSEPLMWGFVLEVDRDGRPELAQTMKLRGQAPAYRSHPDNARIYRWELLDAEETILDSGLLLDRLALYTINKDGACDKSLVGAHGLTLRCAHDARATQLRLKLQSTQSAQIEEEHGH